MLATRFGCVQLSSPGGILEDALASSVEHAAQPHNACVAGAQLGTQKAMRPSSNAQ